MPKGRPHAFWLRKLEACLKDMDMTGWRLPGRWPDGGRRITVASGRGDVLLRRMPPHLTSDAHFTERPRPMLPATHRCLAMTLNDLECFTIQSGMHRNPSKRPIIYQTEAASLYWCSELFNHFVD